MFPSLPPPSSAPHAHSQHRRLEETAQAFEQVFLSQALQSAGLHRPPAQMNGGAGEDMFASFLADAHARALVARGGIGLAEHLVRAMTKAGVNT